MQTTLCYISRAGRTLMLYRDGKKDDPNGGKWVAVGGKLEFGESPEECMLREVFEETGYRLTRYRARGLVTFLSGDWCEYMYLFSAEAPEGEPAPCDEGTLAWVPDGEVDALPAWAGDRIFNRLLRERETYFSLKLVYEGERLVRAALDGRELAL